MIGALLAESTTPTFWGVPLTGGALYMLYRAVTSTAAAANSPATRQAIRELFSGPTASTQLKPTYKVDPSVQNEIARLASSSTPTRPQASGQKSSFVFLSYRRVNSAVAMRLRKQLEDAGIDVWMDTEQLKPGGRWNREIPRAIEECGAFVCLMAGEPGPVVQREILWAERCEKLFFPVSLDGGLFFEIAEKQFVPTTDGRVPPDFIRHLRAVLAS